MVEGARIVSLLPAATEIVAALGAMRRLVGVTHACDFPEGARTLPRVTSSALDADASALEIDTAVRTAASEGQTLFALDAARIRALAPDVIITQALCDVCAVSEADVRAVAASLTPSPRIISLGAGTLDDVMQSIGTVGHAIGAQNEAAEVNDALRLRLHAVHLTLKSVRAPRFRVAVVEWTDPLYVAGHWVPDMVRRAGGIDAVATPGEHSRSRTVRELQDAGPEILIFAPCGFDMARSTAEARCTLERPEWEWARPLPCFAIDGNAFTSRPGPRLVDGVEIFARIFNPRLFSPLGPERAHRVQT